MASFGANQSANPPHAISIVSKVKDLRVFAATSKHPVDWTCALLIWTVVAKL